MDMLVSSKGACWSSTLTSVDSIDGNIAPGDKGWILRVFRFLLGHMNDPVGKSSQFWSLLHYLGRIGSLNAKLAAICSLVHGFQGPWNKCTWIGSNVAQSTYSEMSRLMNPRLLMQILISLKSCTSVWPRCIGSSSCQSDRRLPCYPGRPFWSFPHGSIEESETPLGGRLTAEPRPLSCCPCRNQQLPC